MTTYHSIWLMPSGKLNDTLRELILQLSRTYAAPVFPPHVTLIGNLEGSETELSARTQQLAASVRPFQAHLTVVDYLDEYFRCVFLRAEETPALLEANRQARVMFQREQDPPFMPHLSLLYGDYSAALKAQIIESIGREFDQTFPVSQLHLYSTTGEPKEWYRVQSYEVQGR